MPGGDIYDNIVEALEANGNLDQRTYRRLMLLALVDLGRTQQACKLGLAEMNVKVKLIEENSIMLWARRNPKISVPAIVIFIVLTIYIVAHLGLFNWILEYLGLPPIPMVTP